MFFIFLVFDAPWMLLKAFSNATVPHGAAQIVLDSPPEDAAPMVPARAETGQPHNWSPAISGNVIM